MQRLEDQRLGDLVRLMVQRVDLLDSCREHDHHLGEHVNQALLNVLGFDSRIIKTVRAYCVHNVKDGVQS